MKVVALPEIGGDRHLVAGAPAYPSELSDLRHHCAGERLDEEAA
jgi:hypothetical protein